MDNKLKCEYCKNIFSSRSCLKTHQQKANYCLKIQKGLDIHINIKVKIHQCDYCSKVVTSKENLYHHINNCKAKQLFEIQKLKEYIEKLELDLEKEKENNRLLILQLEKENAVITREKEIYKDLNKDANDCIQEIAKQPKITQTNNNIVNGLVPFNSDDWKLPELSAGQILKRGKGYAEYFAPNLKDQLVCSDVSRLMFMYKDENGRILRDPKLLTLSPQIFDAIQKASSEIIDNFASDNPPDFQNDDSVKLHSSLRNTQSEIGGIINGQRNNLQEEFARELAPRVIKN
jgi:site-specific DNA-adenine methylase